MKKADKIALIATLNASAADIGYAAGTASADLSDTLGKAHRFGSAEDYERISRLAVCGRIVSYLERPPLTVAKAAAEYVGRHWGNYERAQRYEAADAILAKAPAKSDKPDRRTALEEAAVNAARSAISTARKNAGIVSNRTNKGGRKPRPSANEAANDSKSFTVSPARFDNDEDASAFFSNAIAALCQTAEINQQTGSKKDVKRIAFAVQSILLDAKAAIAKALQG